MRSLRILALEPYYGGAHAAFIDGWQAHSQHTITVLTQPAHHWKWRMRHSGISFAAQVLEQYPAETFDLVWASSMLNLAEFKGLAPAQLAQQPSILYFHENQIEYPKRQSSERDVHFALIHWASALAANAVWFNSKYNQKTFLEGLATVLRMMPSPKQQRTIEQIASRSSIQWPGIDDTQKPSPVSDGPLHIIWAARWEHDKGPEIFFAAIEKLAEHGETFELSVIGQQFKTVPDVFEEARQRLETLPNVRVACWGYQPSRASYESALKAADVFVSTATHEFFGISALEAAALGCTALLPNSLAYPELYPRTVLYDGTSEALAGRLSLLAAQKRQGQPLPCITELASRFCWHARAAEMDEACLKLCPRP